MRTLFSFLLIFALSSCSSGKSDPQILRREYHHSYGPELTENDWKKRGGDGIVTSHLKNGITLYQSYACGILHGETRETYPYGEQISKRSFYDNGRLARTLTHYPSGGKKTEKVFISDEEKSIRHWFEEQNLCCEEHFQGEKLVDGSYYNLDGSPESSVREGTGIQSKRDTLGRLESQFEFKEGELILHTRFHNNGFPSKKTPYVDAKVEGSVRSYLNNGQLTLEEDWVQDLRHGLSTRYFQSKKQSIMPFIQGKKEGIEQRFHNGNLLVAEVTWIANRRHGPARYYSEGEETRTEWYHRGDLVTEANYIKLSHTQRGLRHGS